MGMYKVLIVDDERDVRSGYARFFPWESLGFEVAVTAGSGAQAMDTMKRIHIDVMICDIEMPDMNGIELIRAIRAQDLDMAIVVLSGHDLFEYARELLSYQVAGYILKSEKQAVLMELMRSIKERLDARERVEQDIVSRAQQYVSEHFATANLRNAAAYVHVSVPYLSRTFKDRSGMNFNAFLLDVKLRRAEKLLENRDRRIHEIAEELGYADTQSFNRVFKKATGMTPKEYQKNTHRNTLRESEC